MVTDYQKLAGSWRCAHAYKRTRSDSDLQVYGWVHLFHLVELYCYLLGIIGTAIYFLSPRWPYPVNGGITLDSQPIDLVDLVDYSQPDTGGGPETVPSSVVWKATELENVQHTLVVSVAQGQPYAIVDGLMSVFFRSFVFFH